MTANAIAGSLVWREILDADSPDRKRCPQRDCTLRCRPRQAPLFDCHIHYSFDATEAYPPASAVKLLDQAGIGRAVVSSTPNDGTIKLHALILSASSFPAPVPKGPRRGELGGGAAKLVSRSGDAHIHRKKWRVASIGGSANST